MANNQNGDEKVVNVIIKKVKKKGEHGSHGGSWKIAYADFVTAMMAFFMLMWLLNVTSEEQRKGIADYFVPNIINMKSRNGAGGMMGGVNVSNPNNSSGKGNEPSPVDKPEEIIVEDVTSDAMASESKKITKAPEAMEKNGDVSTSLSEELQNMQAPATATDSSSASQTSPSSTTPASPNPPSSDAASNTAKSAPAIAAHDSTQKMAAQTNTKSLQQEKENSTAQSSMQEQGQAKSLDSYKGQDAGKNESTQKNEGINFAKGEASHMGAPQKQMQPKGEKKPSDNEALEEQQKDKNLASGTLEIDKQDTKNQTDSGRSKDIAKAVAKSGKTISQESAKESAVNIDANLNNPQKEQGTKETIANRNNFTAPKGQNAPAVKNSPLEVVAEGMQKALGKNINQGVNLNHAEVDGKLKPTQTPKGSMLAKGKETALVKIQSTSQEPSTEHVSNQAEQENLQDALEKNRDTGQSGGRQSTLARQLAPQNKANLAQDQENNTEGAAHKQAQGKEMDKDKAKLEQQIQGPQQDRDKDKDRDKEKAPQQQQLSQEELLARAIEAERRRAEIRKKTLVYHRSISQGMSARSKENQKKLMKAKADSLESLVAQKALQELQTAEERQLKSAMAEIMASIEKNPELKGLLPHLVAEIRPEGLRIQLIDQDKLSMFALGSNALLPQAQKILSIVAKLILPLENQLVISGHTDSTPYINPKRYSNWELSADRANATRRALVSFGVPESRFESVMGKEATDPYLPENPTDASNRRISITLLRLHGSADSHRFNELTSEDAETIQNLKEEVKNTTVAPSSRQQSNTF